MGGRGSTRWKGKAIHPVVENQERLDACRLLHQGRLEPGAAGLLDTGLHYLNTVDGKLILWGPCFFQEIPLSWAPPWRRPLFRCACGRGARYLYVSGARYVCTTCAGLWYRSQQLRPHQRRIRRLKKLLARMGSPPGSHFLQLVSQGPPRRCGRGDKGRRWVHPWVYPHLWLQYIQVALKVIQDPAVARDPMVALDCVLNYGGNKRSYGDK